MIKSRALLFIGLTMLILFSLSAGSLALFTSEGISSANTITTGNMYIGDTNGERGILDKWVTLENMIPGAEPQRVKLTVKNLGTMTAHIKGLSAFITESDDKFVANAIQTRCLNNGKELYKGSLLALDGNVMPLNDIVSLEAGKTTELELLLQLDERAGNWYKGKKLEFSFSVYAFQNKDQEIDNRTHLAEQDAVQRCLDEAEPGDVVLIKAGMYKPLRVKAGVAVKAKDVVFDTVVEGFKIDIPSDNNSQGNANSVQGFTINSPGNGILVKTGDECKISDNIINSAGCPVQVINPRKASFIRNDVTGCKEFFNGNKFGKDIFAKYNLGDDLDPEEDAL